MNKKVAKKVTKKKVKDIGGRPIVIEINWSEFDRLCKIQCTQKEIASWFDCSISTIERKVRKEKGMGYADYYEQKREKGFISLRRKQYEVALEGNVAMLIFLGKNLLGQSDKTDMNVKGEVRTWVDLMNLCDEEKEKAKED